VGSGGGRGERPQVFLATSVLARCQIAGLAVPAAQGAGMTLIGYLRDGLFNL
jgi:hypothetical protein